MLRFRRHRKKRALAFMFGSAILSILLFQNFVIRSSVLPSVSALDQRYVKTKSLNSPWSYNFYFEDVFQYYLISGNQQYLEQILKNGDDMTALTADKNTETSYVDAFTGLKPKVLLSIESSCGMPAAFLVHHSIEWRRPVAAARMYLLLNQGKMISSKIKNQIKNIIETAMMGLDYFHKDVVKGAYVTPTYPDSSCIDSDISSANFGKAIPVYMAATAGLLADELKLFFELAPELLEKISPNFNSNSQEYLAREKNNFLFAKNSVRPYLSISKGGQLHWKSVPNGQEEDTSHAGLVIPFLIRLYDTNVLDYSFMDALVKTFKATYNGSPERVHSHIGPKSEEVRLLGDIRFTTALVRWMPLARFDCSVYQASLAILNYVDSKGEKIYYTDSGLTTLEAYSSNCK